MKTKLEAAAAGALLFLFILLSATSARHKSATIDEFAHLAAGCYAWRTHDFSLFWKTPPLGRLLLTLPAYLLKPGIPTLPDFRHEGWLPWVYGTAFMYENAGRYRQLLSAARAAVIALGALTCFLIWRWSRRRYGPAGGMVSLAAAVLSPTMLAHSQVVTTDVISGLSTLLLALALLAYLRRPALRRALLLGAVFALGILCKFSAPLFAPFVLAAPFALLFRAEPLLPRHRSLLLIAIHTVLIIAALWLTIICSYLGQKVSFHREFQPGSRLLLTLKPLTALVPLPADFLVGLDEQLYDAEMQEFENNNYLFGRNYSGNRWYYYLVAVAVKEPLPELAIFLSALILIFRRKPRRPEELLLAGMIIWFVVVVSLFNRLQIGIRYLLSVYPLAFVMMGAVGEKVFGNRAAKEEEEQKGERRAALSTQQQRRHRRQGKRRAALSTQQQRQHQRQGERKAALSTQQQRRWQTFLQAALLAGGGWALAEMVWVWPDYLAYFSPFVGGPKNGHKILLDSNVDWGQDLPGLKKWMNKHNLNRIDLAYFGHEDPLLYDILYDLPARNSPNRFIAISAHFLHGRLYNFTYHPEPLTKEDPLFVEVQRYLSREPVAVIGGSIFVYEKINSKSGKK